MLFRNQIVTAVTLMLALVVSNGANCGNNADYLPQSPAASKEIFSYDLQGIKQDTLLALVSLQGLANRIEPKIFTYSKSYSDKPLKLYKEVGYVTRDTPCTDVYKLLKQFRSSYKGVVVYDPARRYTINLASNIAGVQNRVILSAEMLKVFQSKIDSKVDVLDLRKMDFATQRESFEWYKKNIFPHQTKQIISVAKDVYMYDVFRDYTIEFKIPTFWLPGESDEDYSKENVEDVIWILENTPPNIPVFGFWPGLDEGKDVGYSEFFGTELASKYGKFVLVNTWVGNYSYHTGVLIDNQKYVQTKVRQKEFHKFDPSKKYVALVMVESGDAPAYFQFDGFLPRQWWDPARGSVPISYGLSTSLRQLLPGIMRHIYDTATENDYIFCPISGAGYCYPLLGLCDSTANGEQNRQAYFKLTGDNMRAMDMDMIALYTHPGEIKWSSEDSLKIKTSLEYMGKGVKSLISGMHRTGYKPSEGSGFIGDNQITVHHTMTHWSYDDYDLFRSGVKGDKPSAEYLANDIRNSSEATNFITAMFYSWHYGPTRLKMTQDILEQEGYIFVTMNELDYLYRESLNR